MAPEMISEKTHDHTLDIWCLGVLLYELLHGKAPFKGRNDIEKCRNIVEQKEIEFDEFLGREVENFKI
jgi:serine/threonine protein kinase